MKLTDKIKNFFKEVYIQGKKVDWPRKKEALNLTLIVLGVTVGVAAFLGFLDFLFVKLLNNFVF